MSYTDFISKGGLVAIRQSDFVQAREFFSYVIQTLRNLVKAKPNHQRATLILVKNLNQLALVDINDGKLEEAQKLLDEAAELLPKLTTPAFSDLPYALGTTFVDLANAFRKNDDGKSYRKNMEFFEPSPMTLVKCSRSKSENVGGGSGPRDKSRFLPGCGTYWMLG